MASGCRSYYFTENGGDKIIDMAGQGMAGQGAAMLGKARQGKANLKTDYEED